MSQPPKPPEEPEFTTASITWVSLIFYGGIVGLAFALAWLFNIDLNHTSGLVRAEGGVDWQRASIDLAIGASAGLAVVLVCYLTRKLPMSTKLFGEFRRLLGPLGLAPITVLSLSAAIAEEILFRGVLQPKFGYIGVSLLFGVLHAGLGKRLSIWFFFATAMGFLLGGLYAYTETLLAPMVAHFTINYFNYKLSSDLPQQPPEYPEGRP